jgi:hypothetical protein
MQMSAPTVAGLQDCVQRHKLAPDEPRRQQHCRCTQEQMLQMFLDYDCWVFDCDGEAMNAITPTLSRWPTVCMWRYRPVLYVSVVKHTTAMSS